MLITALRDLQWRQRRFVIATLGTGLVFALTLILTGLAHGFRVEAQRVVDSLGIDTYLIKAGAEGPFVGSSTFPQAETKAVAALDGVEEAVPLIYINVIMKDRATPENVNVYGVPDHGLGAPPITAGRTAAATGEVVVSTTLGRAVDDDIELGGVKLHIVGLAGRSTTLAGQPNAFVTVPQAQQLVFSGQPVVSTIGLRGTPANVPDGYRVVDRSEAVDDMVRPLSGARQAMSLMAYLLWAVAGLIVGSLIYLSALERTRDFAVFKAVGVNTREILAGLVMQAVLVAVLAAALGGAVAVALGPLFPMLVSVTNEAFVLLLVTAVLIGLLASLAGLRHAIGIDPVLAFGGP